MTHKEKRLFLASVVLGILLLGELCAYVFPINATGEARITEYADKVVAACKNESYRPTCYEEEIPKLMDMGISMEDTVRIAGIVQAKDRSYAYCHVLGHKISAKETAKDPDKWTEVIQRCPSGFCSNGCIHGAFQERFRKESLTDEEIMEYKSEFANVCEPQDAYNPTGLEQASCYHALGHLLMYITRADVPKSLGLCRELAVKPGKDMSQVCGDGVFMQIFQPLEPDDFDLIKGKEVATGTERAYCAPYSGFDKSSCWSESWPLKREELKVPGAISRWCNELEETGPRERCKHALVFVYVAQLEFDNEKISSFCDSMLPEDRGLCYADAASRLLENDYRNIERSAALCDAAAEKGVGDTCYDIAVRTASFTFHPGSPEAKKLCSLLPPKWQTNCGGFSR
ncbi:MAG TPA: hypothetical protein VD967_02295 [Candidatus Paceibacterota bacterium]|nr:hypothetical protein [Candidatus Paceibacterota bacterium]